jgi:hypothetical protein
MTTAILLASAVTNIAVTAQLLETRRRLRNAQRMFQMYARTNKSPRRTVIARNPAPWEIR